MYVCHTRVLQFRISICWLVCFCPCFRIPYFLIFTFYIPIFHIFACSSFLTSTCSHCPSNKQLQGSDMSFILTRSAFNKTGIASAHRRDWLITKKQTSVWSTVTVIFTLLYCFLEVHLGSLFYIGAQKTHNIFNVSLQIIQKHSPLSFQFNLSSLKSELGISLILFVSIFSWK